ncbi:MAG TPA: histidine--tRNA ligase [Gemmatimonadales bacterium]|jgi:histidyl-tRNA synthetase
MQFRALPGFRDVFPDTFARRRKIVTAWREVAARYGFEEYDGPPLESLELYTAKSGEEIVGQIYSFNDKGGRSVALRPEMTPTLARMVSQRAGALRKPIRWFSVPQLFRYERQQRGRLREHLQLNMDIIGEPGPLADAEIIAAAIDIMRALGFGPKEVRVRLSDRRILAAALTEGLGVLESELPGVLGAFDRYEKSKEAAEEAIAKVIGDESRAHTVREFAAALGDSASLMDLPAAAHLKECLAHLEAMGLGEFVDVDFRIVRGLAYYTGIVFELFDAGKSLRAICGGGRYDELLKQIGGVDLPMVGFGMGDVVLGELIEDRDGPPAAGSSADIFVITVGDDDVATALDLTHALRERGLRVEYALHKLTVGKQLELAVTRGVRQAIVIGPDERAKGEAVVRQLADKHEERVSLDTLKRDYEFSDAHRTTHARLTTHDARELP